MKTNLLSRRVFVFVGLLALIASFAPLARAQQQGVIADVTSEFQRIAIWDSPNGNVRQMIFDPKWDGTLPSTLFVDPKTGYRKFFGRPMTDRQIDLEVGRLVGLKK